MVIWELECVTSVLSVSFLHCFSSVKDLQHKENKRTHPLAHMNMKNHWYSWTQFCHPFSLRLHSYHHLIEDNAQSTWLDSKPEKNTPRHRAPQPPYPSGSPEERSIWYNHLHLICFIVVPPNPLLDRNDNRNSNSIRIREGSLSWQQFLFSFSACEPTITHHHLFVISGYGGLTYVDWLSRNACISKSISWQSRKLGRMKSTLTQLYLEIQT